MDTGTRRERTGSKSDGTPTTLTASPAASPAFTKGGTMTRLNLLADKGPGCWSRLYRRVREMRFDQKHNDMRAAYRLMAEEQRADGIARGLTMCDVPWCGHSASHVWVRSAKDLKSMRRKHKGAWLEGAPESIRCETHVPDWRVDVYRRISAAQAVAA